MDIIKGIMTLVAVCLPLTVCIILVRRLMKNRAADEWKLATCVSGLAVVTSLICLMAAERVLFIRYGDLALEITHKADEVRTLTEQNKQMAIATAKAIIHSRDGVILGDGSNDKELLNSLEELLNTTGATTNAINQILGRTNSAPPTH